MTWTIELDPAVEKDLSKLDSQQAKRILRFLFERVAHLEDPRSIGEALRGSRFTTLWKYRVRGGVSVLPSKPSITIKQKRIKTSSA